MLAIWAFVGLTSSVTFAADAVRVDTLLKDLTHQTGVDLRCDAEIGAQPVVADFHDRPLDDVLSVLAKVVDAVWEERSDGRSLTRPTSLRIQQEREEAARISQLVARQVHQAVAEVDAIPKLDIAEADRVVDRYRLADLDSAAMQAEFVRLATTSPVRREAVHLLATIDPKDLGAMRVGERVVFSDVPNATQRRLPKAANEPLEDLREECRMLIAAHERLGERQRPKVNFGGLPEVGPGNFEVGYGKTLLACTRAALGRFRLSLLVVDKNGDGIVAGTTDLPSRVADFTTSFTNRGRPLRITDAIEQFAFLRRDIGYAAAGGGQMGRLPDGTPVRGRFAISMGESEGLPPDLGLGPTFSDPLRWDPLGYVFGPLMRQIAAAEGRPLLATISDDSVSSLLTAVNARQLSTHDGLKQFLSQTQVEEGARIPHGRAVEHEGWLAFKPWLPVAARNQRFDRGALRTLIGRIRSEGALLLNDALAYLSKSRTRPGLASLDTMIVLHAVPEVDRESIEWMIRSDALPLFASMNTSQLERAMPGQTLRDLSPEQKEWVRRWVFEQARFDMVVPVSGPGGRSRAIDQEPTEIFPTGVPLESGFQIERSQAPAVLVSAKSGYRFALDLDAMGYQESRGPKGDFLGVKFDRQFVGYRPGVQTSYTVKLLIPGRPDLTTMLLETRPVPGSQQGPREALPPEILERIERARKAFSGGG